MASILDFGAGWKARHTVAMRATGHAVTAWDIGRNFDPYVHADNALTREYDVVMASNVINTHATEHALRRTLAQMSMATYGRGVCVCNYPATPRKGAWTNQQMIAMVREFFGEVDVRFYHGSAVFTCRCPIASSAFEVLENGGEFTADELNTCTIRPVGAVGGNAIVPRIVASIVARRAESEVGK